MYANHGNHFYDMRREGVLWYQSTSQSQVFPRCLRLVPKNDRKSAYEAELSPHTWLTSLVAPLCNTMQVPLDMDRSWDPSSLLASMVYARDHVTASQRQLVIVRLKFREKTTLFTRTLIVQNMKRKYGLQHVSNHNYNRSHSQHVLQELIIFVI
jgi:hypothetical protein